MSAGDDAKMFADDRGRKLFVGEKFLSIRTRCRNHVLVSALLQDFPRCLPHSRGWEIALRM